MTIKEKIVTLIFHWSLLFNSRASHCKTLLVTEYCDALKKRISKDLIKKKRLLTLKVIIKTGMGIVLGVEAAVGIAEGAEGGAGAAEAIGSTAEAAETISAGADAGAEAGSAAADQAAGAVGSGGEALPSAVETLTNALSKLGKMVEEFIVIDSVFKAAKKILEALLSDPSALARTKRIDKLIKVLNQSSSLMNAFIDWLQVHAEDTTDLKDITVTTQGVLSKFIPHLGAEIKMLIITFMISSSDKC